MLRFITQRVPGRRVTRVWTAAVSIAGDPLAGAPIDLTQLAAVAGAALDAIAARGGTVDDVGLAPVGGRAVLVWIVYRERLARAPPARQG